jgi:hypothetical protein
VLDRIQKRWSSPELLVAALGILLALILFVDIGAAIGTGTYLTLQPPIAQTLGRWLFLFLIRQVDIYSPQVEWLFLIWASLSAVLSVLYLWQPVRMRFLMIVFALLSFWYFPIGSWLGVAMIILLAWTKVQSRST